MVCGIKEGVDHESFIQRLVIYSKHGMVYKENYQDN